MYRAIVPLNSNGSPAVAFEDIAAAFASDSVFAGLAESDDPPAAEAAAGTYCTCSINIHDTIYNINTSAQSVSVKSS